MMEESDNLNLDVSDKGNSNEEESHESLTVNCSRRDDRSNHLHFNMD